ncbi:MAG TPA: AMP-binding protein, partial [Gemmatimonadaceae bacterium]
MGLDELAAAAAARLPADAIAVACDSGSLTYAELDELANRVANALAEASVGVGDRVGLWLPRSPEVVAAMQGVLRLRACYVPIDPNAPVKRATAILGDCGVRAVITSHERVSALTGEQLAARYLTWREVTTADGAPRERAPSSTDDLAFILYTSGSTGKPKGVCITHGNAHEFVAWSAAAVGARAGDRFSNHAPFHFDLSVFDLYASFLVGGSTHLVPDSASYAPAALVDFVREQRIDIWYSVPSALVLMESGGMLDRDELPMRVVIFAGEPYPIKNLRRLRKRFPRVRLFN